MIKLAIKIQRHLYKTHAKSNVLHIVKNISPTGLVFNEKKLSTSLHTRNFIRKKTSSSLILIFEDD